MGGDQLPSVAIDHLMGIDRNTQWRETRITVSLHWVMKNLETHTIIEGLA
jgi:hypothetical protein